MKSLTLTIFLVTLSVLVTEAQIGHWKMNDNANDDSGSNLNGTLVNSPTFSTDSKEGTHALTLNGTTQFIELGNPSSLPSGNTSVTLAGWAKTNFTTGSHTIIAFGKNSTNQGISIGQQGSSVNGGGFSDVITSSTGLLQTNTWYHFAMTYDGTTVKLYLDGSEVASAAKTINISHYRAHIGKNINNSSFWGGSIDDVRLYDYALSASEVQALANNAPQPPTAPTGLSVSPQGTSQINLSWTDNASDETGYQIERSTSETTGFALIHTTVANATTYNNTGLNSGTTYYYRVRAVNSNGNSPYSNTANATTSSASGSGPIGHWKVNNNANDDSGNDMHGTLVNSPTFSTDSKEGTHSLSLNGTSQFIELGNPSTLPSGNTSITLAAWAKTNFSTGSHTIIAFGNNSTNQGVSVGQQGSSVNGGGFGSVTTSSTGLIQTNTWYHFAMTYDGTTVKLYLDGNEVASQAKTINIAHFRAHIGKNINNSSFWGGSIDDARIYDRALSVSEIQQLASAAPQLPAAPTQLGAAAQGSSQIDLSWTDNASDETGYEIERSTNETTGFALIHTTAANATSYSNTGLSAGTTYYYRVRAINGNGGSSYSNTASATTSSASGSGPIGHWKVNNNANDESGNNLDGTLVNSPTFSTDSKEGTHSLTFNGSNQLIELGNPSTLPSGNASVTLAAWAKTNFSTGSHTIVAFGTPSTNQGVSIGQQGSSVNGGSFGSVTTSSTGLVQTNTWYHFAMTYDGTTVKLYLNGSEVASAAKSINITLFRAHIGKNVNNASWWGGSIDDVRIYDRALTAAELAALMSSSPQPLAAPSALSAMAAGASQINLSWTDNSSNETGFEIQRSLSSGSGFTTIHTTAANATSYNNTGLNSSTTYYYRVRAVNAEGSSEYTSNASATTGAETIAAPSNLVATTASSTSINLTWNDNSSNETGFQIQRAPTSGGTYSTIHTTAANVTSYTNTGLSSNTTYYYRVRATNGTINSAYTSLASATTTVTLAAPGCVTAGAVSSTTVELSWGDSNTAESGYQIERSTSPTSGFSVVTTTGANTTAYTDKGVTAGNTYYYRIKAKAGSSLSAASATASASTGTAAQDVMDQLAFQYRYDSRKRMIAKKVPGADWVYMVYDDRDRLVLTQDGNQRTKRDGSCNSAPEWTFTKYDALNRPVLTGILVDVRDRETLQEAVNDFYEAAATNADEWYEARGSAVHGYTNQSFPKVSDQDRYLTATYYDDDSYKALITTNASEYNYNACDITGQYFYSGTTCGNKTSFPRLKGMVTAAKTRVLGETVPTWLWSVNHYDDKGRVVQNIATNPLGGVDRVTTKYDFVGKVLETKTTHNAGAGDQQIVTRTFDYDHAGRLINTWHKLNAANPVLLAQNEYNEIGQLVTKKLHSPNGNNFEQNVDYRYNIRGWLTSMNGEGIREASDLFGMDLRYNVPTIAGIEGQFNGNISQIDWKGPNPENQQYGYVYDPMNRLLHGKYFSPGKDERYDEKIWNGTVGAAYDLNGNILGIERGGKTGVDSGSGVNTFGAMDVLTYSYRGNQLLKVMDAAVKTEGFKDGSNTGDDYTYDANGNMQVDQNKGIDAASTSTGNSTIAYNYLNLPEKVRKNTGEYIRYIYDATGRKLRQEVYNVSNQLVKKSVYAGEFFYEGESETGNTQATLKFINTEEGRVVMTDAPEYQYHLKDHLGNVRVTFTTKEETEAAVATMEHVNAGDESGEFLFYDEAVTVHSELFDHTNDGAGGGGTSDPDDTTYNISTRLSGTATEQFGLAKSLSVMPGDVVRIEVFAKYIDPDDNNWQPTLVDLLNDIASDVPGVLVDNGVTGSIGNYAFPYGALLSKSSGGTVPKAFLNYITFNKDYEPLFDPSQTNFVAITSSAKENGSNVPHERLFAEITVKEAGLMYIYLSNDNVALGGDPVDVFFDDFKVEHIKSPVVQMDDYYPFGLTFNSYKRENSVENMYQYNGKERQDELNLNWLDFGARMHQPELGRFFTVDPRSEAYNFQTPYAYAANNPVKFIEVNGEGPGDPIKNLNDAAKAVRSSINQMVSKSVKNNVEYSAMITASHLPNYEVGKGMTSVDKVFNFENERTDNSINNVGFDRKVNGAEQGKVHTHTEDGMAPSPGDVLNLLENKDSSKQGFFSLVATESKFFALVIEDPEKATKFLESNRYSLADDAANMVLELHHDKGISESGAQKEAIFQLLKNSGIGFYEAYNSENPEFNKVKSQQR